MITKLQSHRLIFLLLIFISVFFRVVGLNWDQSQHLHPDERFMTMVTSDIEIPPNIQNYFSQTNSVLNPYNNGYNFYVYGTFPLLITRFFGEVFNMTGYNQIFIIGRLLSVFFDCLTLIFVYKITLLIFNNKKIGLWSMFFYGVSVFPVQQSHFFTVDAFTVFFSTLTIFLFLKFIKINQPIYVLISGISFGLTLANKTSIGIVLPIYIIFIVLNSSKELRESNNFTRFIKKTLFQLFLFGTGSLLMFRLFQPYAFDGLFQISKHFVSNISEAHKMITGAIDYPPNIQWAYTNPLIHPLINLSLWGLGPVATTLSILGIIIFLRQINKKTSLFLFFLLLYISAIFLYQGVALAKYMRYFYPLYPILCLFSGFCLHYFFRSKNSSFLKTAIFLSLIVGSLLPVISFSSIYFRPHSRVAASEWIYENVSPGSKITAEEWDDALPLDLVGKNKSYQFLSLAMYPPESSQKWQKLSQQISEADYIILSSNRLYASIPKMPQRYPVSSLFYQLLFSEKLGFKKVAEFNSRPCFPPIGSSHIFCLNDDDSEESFTVYDHPVIKIFQKYNFSSDLLNPLLDEALINSAQYVNPADLNSQNILILQRSVR